MFPNFEALHEIERGSEIEVFGNVDALETVNRDIKQIAPNIIAIHAKNAGNAEIFVFGKPSAGAATDVEYGGGRELAENERNNAFCRSDGPGFNVSIEFRIVLIAFGCRGQAFLHSNAGGRASRIARQDSVVFLL